MTETKSDSSILKPRPPWPYSPSEDLPQIITFLVVDDADRVKGVGWSEALENVDPPCGRTPLSPDQLERINSWLGHWLTAGPETFTAEGLACVEHMRGALRCLPTQHPHRLADGPAHLL